MHDQWEAEKSPGPSAYHTNFSTLKKMGPKVAFTKAKRMKNIFKISKQPGPGAYELLKKKSVDLGYSFSWDKKAKLFKSEGPGPALYN